MLVHLVGFYRIFNTHNPDITLGYKCFVLEEITSENGTGCRFDKPILVDSSIVNLDSNDALGLYKLYYDSNGRVCSMARAS